MSVIYCQCLTQHISFIPQDILGYRDEGIYASFKIAVYKYSFTHSELQSIAKIHKVPFIFVERSYITTSSTIYNNYNELERLIYTDQQIKVKDFTKFWEEQHTRHQIAQLMRITE